MKLTDKLTRKWKKYSGFVSIGLQGTFAYRFSFFISFLAAFVSALVMYCVWIAVYHEKSQIGGFTLPMMITYLFISQGVTNLYGFSVTAERKIFQKVKSGDLALDLVKPIDFGIARFMEVLGQMGVQAVMVTLVLFVLKIFIPTFTGPANFWYFLLFLLSALLGYVIMFSIGLMTGFVTFWIMSYWGIYNTRKAVVDFLSGAIVPLNLLPLWTQRIFDFLPFKGIVYVPTMIYLGQYSMQQIGVQLLIQLFWCAALWMLASLVYRRAMRKVSVNGG